MRLPKIALCIATIFILQSCSVSKNIEKEIAQQFHVYKKNTPVNSTNVDSLLNNLIHLPVRQREDALIEYMSQGSMPAYNFQFKKVSYQTTTSTGKKLNVSFWVSPDYIAIGHNKNYVRMPLTPQAAQLLADQFNCLLPTTKMVDEIYKKAQLKLVPLPLTENRDSLATFMKHNDLISLQLDKKTPSGIVSGIKKDVIQSTAVLSNPKPNRVAIYGWHTLDGKPIQQLYTGHVDWYVDYSHGVRLVYKKMLLNNRPVFITDVLNNPELSESICNDNLCKSMRYGEAN
tara:strand:- start:502280 stop:503140 length:861 start_codon:yes stop_codon:yes gene_type:complete